jgi:hypothetical protein
VSANNNPIFSRQGVVTSDSGTGMAPTLTTAAADYSGVSVNNKQVFKAGPDGSYIQRLRFKSLGTNVTTVARIYANNGSTNTSAANNSLIGEITLPATTASAVAATPDMDYLVEFALEANFAIYVGLGTSVAAGWMVTPIAGDY